MQSTMESALPWPYLIVAGEVSGVTKIECGVLGVGSDQWKPQGGSTMQYLPSGWRWRTSEGND